MKSRILLILGLIFAASNMVSAQTAKKTVTNLDLEKYRVQREQADADYRENYAKRGMPSPEELQKQEEENAVKREELSRRLASERQITEQNTLRAQIAEQNARINYLNNANLANQANTQIYSGSYPYYGGGIYLNNGYYNRSRWNRPFPPYRNYPQANQPATMAAGGMIFQVPRSTAMPAPQIINRPRSGRRVYR